MAHTDDKWQEACDVSKWMKQLSLQGEYGVVENSSDTYEIHI